MSEEEKLGNQFEGKEEYVRDVFEEIAPYYDRMNGIMSMGMVRRWHGFMMKKAGDIRGFECLDVGSGTGEIAFFVARKAGPQGHVTGLDITPGMLELARRKMAELDLPSQVDFVLGDALDMQYPDGAFDLVTSGYMLRNVTDIPKAVSEMHRVLRPGGKAIVAELARPKNGFVRWFHNIYVSKAVPMMGRRYDGGQKIDGRHAAYDWLTTSLEGFPHGEEMADIFRKAGFSEVRFHVRSMGAVNIYVGVK